MTVKKLVKSTHPILNKTIQPVSTYDQKLKVLLEDLEDTLYHEEAAAISAPQIGVDQSVALIDMEQEGLLQLINPVVKSQSQETVSDLEGSISLPHIYGEVKRSNIIGNAVELTAYDDIARMILHMIDHLNGIQFTKRAHHILNETEVEAYFDNE